MRADLPDIGNPDQDPMSEVGYPTGVVGFHGLFGCKPLALANNYVTVVESTTVTILGRHVITLTGSWVYFNRTLVARLPAPC